MTENDFNQVIIPRTPVRQYLEDLTRARTRQRVRRGPFAGMRYIDRAAHSALIPKLLGIYERELNECVERACAMNFPLIVNIGAAEGYYAVGMALRNPAARVVAFEEEEFGRDALRELARLNRLPCRKGKLAREPGRAGLELHGRCAVRELQLALSSAGRALVICDVEGHEEELLVPKEIPALGRTHLLVEMHDCFRAGMTEMIAGRFSGTHDLLRIWEEPRPGSDFPYRTARTQRVSAGHLAWAVSEFRPERMSWLWMEPKARG